MNEIEKNMSSTRRVRRPNGRRLNKIIPSIRYKSRSRSRQISRPMSKVVSTITRNSSHSPIRRPGPIASYIPSDKSTSVKPKSISSPQGHHQIHSTSPSNRRNVRSMSTTATNRKFRSASYSPQPRFNSRRQLKKGKNNTPPMPSDNFSPKYEMVGEFIPLVDAPTSTYPKIMQPTYVLSIRPERLEQFSQRMGQWMIHCKRPPCVVGKKLDKSQLYRNHTIDSKGGKMKLGEIGCWLSHLKSWQCIAASPYESGTIMEDDASFGTNLQRVDLAMEELKQKNIPWDILFWCHSPIPHVSQYLKPCGLDNWSRASRNNCMGCIAYTIKKHVAQIWSQRAKPIQSPVDVWVAEYFDRFQVYCIKPVLGSILPSVSDTTETMNPGYLKYL